MNNKRAAPAAWQPPSSLEERLLGALLPPRLYCRFRAHRERRRGEAELALLPFLCDAHRASIDVGANKGVYTYWLQRHSRHVYAYEPNPKIFRILARGVQGNITLKPVALSDRSETATLRVPGSGSSYSNQRATLAPAKAGQDYGELAVESRRLDDEGLEDIGFIKIDVEGHELAVLAGAAETITRDRPVLLIEIEETHSGRAIEDSLAAVTAYGYQGLTLIGGMLCELSRFSPEAHHRAPARRQDYVFNFIFLPVD